jgi:uncharacterized RDD family membrane protein YckC
MLAEPAESATLVSGEAVHLEVRLAGAGSRALALMIDVLAQFVLALVLLMFVPVVLLIEPNDDSLLSAYFVVLSVLVTVGYPTVIHAVTRGRSAGKWALGLRVVRDDGGPITWRQSFTRALVGATLEWPGVLLPASWLVSLTTLLTSPRSKRLADLTAGTIVIHVRTPQTWGWVPTTPPGLAHWAASLDLTGLSDDLALAARHFLARSRGMHEPYRSRLGTALSKEIMACTTPGPPPGTPGWAYLAAVIGERHRRAAHRMVRARANHAKLWPELFPVLTQPTGPAVAAQPAAPAMPVPSYSAAPAQPVPSSSVVPAQPRAVRPAVPAPGEHHRIS